jgi:hypothetical protein
MAAPRHMPVPMRCTKSTARMVATVGRASMLQRLRRPKAARTKTTRRDSRRELMDYHLLSVVDEESERYVAPNVCGSAARTPRRDREARNIVKQRFVSAATAELDGGLCPVAVITETDQMSRALRVRFELADIWHAWHLTLMTKTSTTASLNDHGSLWSWGATRQSESRSPRPHPALFWPLQVSPPTSRHLGSHPFLRE